MADVAPPSPEANNAFFGCPLTPGMLVGQRYHVYTVRFPLSSEGRCGCHGNTRGVASCMHAGRTCGVLGHTGECADVTLDWRTNGAVCLSQWAMRVRIIYGNDSKRDICHLALLFELTVSKSLPVACADVIPSEECCA